MARIFWVGGIIIALFALTFGSIDTSANDNTLTQSDLEQALIDYFSSQNFSSTTSIVNTYLNETYLNQTFIDNNYYNYTTYNQTFNDYLTEITNYITNDYTPIILEEASINTINSSTCSEIKFFMKDAIVGAITDNIGTEIVSELESFSGANIEHSFFVTTGDVMIENNLNNFNYDINTLNSIEHDNNDQWSFDITEDLRNKQILINWARSDWDEATDQTIILIENSAGGTVLELVADGTEIRAVGDSGQTGGNIGKQDCGTNNEFCMYQIQFDDDYGVEVKDSWDGRIATFDTNVTQGVDNYTFSSNGFASTGDNIHIRSIYVNSGELIVNMAKMDINSDTHSIDRNQWKEVQVNINPQETFFQVGNVLESVENNQTYFMDIDTSKVQIANAFCKPVVSS